jgi:hypothetical protein
MGIASGSILIPTYWVSLLLATPAAQPSMLLSCWSPLWQLRVAAGLRHNGSRGAACSCNALAGPVLILQTQPATRPWNSFSHITSCKGFVLHCVHNLFWQAGTLCLEQVDRRETCLSPASFFTSYSLICSPLQS